jgi:hypothetical protein
VVNYVYALTMPSDQELGDLAVVASGTSANATSLAPRYGTIAVADCSSDAEAPRITATPSAPAQVSGWTPVYAVQPFTVTLNATDNVGVDRIAYQINSGGITEVSGARAVVAVEETGFTTLRYRAWDTNNQASPWQVLDLRLVEILDQQNNENTPAHLSVGHPIGAGFSFSATGLPDGLSISPATGLISGVTSFNAAGVHSVTVTETRGAASSSVRFTWTVLDVNRPPVIQQPGSLNVVKGKPFALQVVGSDPDGDPSYFTLHGTCPADGQDLPGSITIDPATGRLRHVPGRPGARVHHHRRLVGVLEQLAVAGVHVGAAGRAPGHADAVHDQRARREPIAAAGQPRPAIEQRRRPDSAAAGGQRSGA